MFSNNIEEKNNKTVRKTSLKIQHKIIGYSEDGKHIQFGDYQHYKKRSRLQCRTKNINLVVRIRKNKFQS